MIDQTGKFKGCIFIRQAAEFLGVSVGTLRLWDEVGKLPAARDPQNRYRLYHIRDLQKFAVKNGLARRAWRRLSEQ